MPAAYHPAVNTDLSRTLAGTGSSPDAADSGFRPRAVCYRCFRAAAVCICSLVPRIDNRTEIVVLQHHREMQHPIGTARIVRLGLTRVEVRLARRGNRLRVARLPGDLPTALLYPGPGSRDLGDIPDDRLPGRLVLLDGTWSQARRMLQANPWLDGLSRVGLQPQAPSRYRIRRQPAPACLSTIEAVVQALRVIEPETPGLDRLLDVLDTMVDRQIDFRNATRAQACSGNSTLGTSRTPGSTLK